MTPQDLLSISENIIGKDKLNRRQKADLKALYEMALSTKAYVASKPNELPERSPNELKVEPNGIALDQLQDFKFPKEFNLEIEGEQGSRPMTIQA